MFRSFFLGGFECSSHRRNDGVRLDLSTATGHERFAAADYGRLARHGFLTARDGLRWHRIEAEPNRYDWSSFLPMARAARQAGVEVIWDLCHYGWPDDIDIWSAAFVDRFARFAGAAARVLCEDSDEVPMFCPVNEISYWAWAGAEVGHMNPATRERGPELKRQLVRAALAAMTAVREVHPGARFLFAEPAIHVDPGLGGAEDRVSAEIYRRAQFEAYDMLCGRKAPELGGAPEFLDVIGVNFYPNNQWYLRGGTIAFGHHAYRPFSRILEEIGSRYGRPMIVAETGAEGSARSAWLHYIMDEVDAAAERGAPVSGVCLYPILDCPGWVNERQCPVGLFSAADSDGRREPYEPMLKEIRRQQSLRGEPARPVLQPIPARQSRRP